MRRRRIPAGHGRFAAVRRRRSAAAAVAVGAALVGAAGCGSSAPERPLPPAPAGADALPSLERQAGRLLGGGVAAFEARLAGLRGHPVVVNQWASWCGPCRYEFPFFAALATRYKGRVAFLGVNTRDSREPARRFLDRYRVPFPSYLDPDADVARRFRGGRAFPTTAYYDVRGRLVFVHAGAYATEGKLDEDIRRHLLNG